MKTVALFAMFVVLAGVFCGGKTGPQAPAATVKWPAEATGALTEDNMAQLVKVLPALSAALKAANWTPAAPKEGDGPVASLTNFVEGMNVPGVDEAVKEAGGWSKLRPTLYKLFAASAALSIDGVQPEMIEQMKADTSAAAKKGLKDYEAFKAACSQIPAENKLVVTNHQMELQALQTLGQ
jgi:hypothetical protein